MAVARKHTLDKPPRSAVREPALSTPDAEDPRIKGWQDIRATSETDGSVTLDALVEGVSGFYIPVAGKKRQRLIVSTQAVASIQGNAELLAHALGILLHNAIESTPPGGLVLLSLEPQSDAAVITVSDTSLGMPSAERNQAVSKDPIQNTGHTEGKLSVYRLQVVNVIARLHRAELFLGDNNPGLRAELRFPC